MSDNIVIVPDLGGTDSVEVIELSVAAGDSVAEGDTLIVVESDKASMDIPAPYSGTIIEVLVAEGAEVAEGDQIVKMAGDGSAEQASENSDKKAAGQIAKEAAADISGTSVDKALIDKSPAQEPEAQSATENTAQSITEVVPDLGGAESVEVIEISVAIGDEVAEGDALLVLESDKASMDLPASVSGTITAIHVAVGDSVGEGGRVFDLQSASAANVEQSPAAAAASDKASATGKKPSAQQPDISRQTVAGPRSSEAPAQATQKSESTAMPTEAGKSVYAGPAVRKLARELGVDLSQVKGTGPKSRIAKEDLHEFVKRAVKQGGSASPAISGIGIAPLPVIDFAQFGAIETVPMTKMQKVTSANMQRSWLTVPHVTHFDNADITELDAFRQSLKKEMEVRGVKVSPVAFLFKAVAATLRAVPAFNVSIGADGTSIVHKDYVHIGMAVDTPNGLLVPVIRDVDKKGLWEIAAEISELAGKAKDRKLKPNEMMGACFTISSLGAIGGTGFTPIVNTPEVGILGVSNASVQPVYIDGEFQPRNLLPLALSYDHRVVNGGDAGRFMTHLTACLGDLRRLLL